MFSSRDAFESDFCPVHDELLGEMYRASASGLPRLVESVSPDARAKLALFCYRRSHLHSLAVAIAGSCSERDLIENGGRVGSTLYALSRESVTKSSPSLSGGRKPITLSTKPLSVLAPLDDELDDEISEAVPA
ncbi:hypothetical protein [Bradyrhizobium sp. CCBAU 11361]|uniref:hypothetical protein n=1 Tax=Bradyrhizobium sp. CCBAU 11361 TaxID=1630812 RepID=UPI00230526CA|nr:hypothetical protein [Bradyrhizobium sp. CCBAU 11361]MDA9494291.1 hypothetical protein [Bradyrhizobium sp. CCBAU 11361]